uniref:Putative glycerol kinase n=1 Tax=Schistosoma mansoni TaxID=6183 RepID=A0A3Q0KKS7_SCHMA
MHFSGTMCAYPQRNQTVSKFILGVDFGSTHACARVYTMDLKVVGCSSTKVPRLERPDGACELDPEAVWESFCKLLDEALQDAEINPDRINCIGISVQRNSLLLWDKKTSNPRTRVITWQDTRSLDLAKKLNHSFIFRSMKTAGHMLYWMTHQSRFKALASYHFKTALACIRLKYLLNEKPKLIDECRKGLLCYGCLETWLLWRLTGGKTFATDVSCASVTGMYDSFSRKWSRPILASLGIPANILPGVYPSSYYYGTVQNGPLGYSSNPSLSIPITGIIGDAQAATLTENCLSPFQAKLTLGTGMFLNLISGSRALALMNGFYPVIGWASGQAYFDSVPTFEIDSTSSSSESPSSVLSTSRSVHLDNLTYLVEGFYPHAGTLIDWLKSENIFSTYSELEEILYSGDQLGLDEKATRENIFYIPLLRNTLINHQNTLVDEKLNRKSFYGPDGLVIGLDYSKSADKLLVARVFIESIAFCTKLMLENYRKQTRISPSILYVNGNVARSNWLLQRMSNTIGIPVERRGLEECSCLGAAIVAGVGAGLWPSFFAATEALHKRLQSEANSLPSVDINNANLNKKNNKSNSHELYRRFMPESSEICISIKKRYHIWSHLRASYLPKKSTGLKLV